MVGAFTSTAALDDLAEADVVDDDGAFEPFAEPLEAADDSAADVDEEAVFNEFAIVSSV